MSPEEIARLNRRKAAGSATRPPSAHAPAAPLDFSHLRPAPTASAGSSSSSFATRLLTADAATRGEAFDPAKLATAPAQRRAIATGDDILAAHRAAHPSRYAGT